MGGEEAVKSWKTVVSTLGGGSRVVVGEDEVAGGGLVEVRGDGRS